MQIFTPESARAAGITRAQLYGPRFRRLFQGAFVTADVLPSLQVLVAAAQGLYPDATITGATALRMLGASIGTDCPVHLATNSRVRRQGIITTNTSRGPGGGVATLPDALEDAQLSTLDEVVTLDELRRLRAVSRADMAALDDRRPQLWRASIANSGSVRESQTRMLLHLAGLPSPLPQHVITDATGRFLARVDMAWPAHKVLVEYEGQQHLTNSDQWESDIRRYEELKRLGWHVIRVTAATLRDPVALVVRVETALRAGGWRGRGAVLDAAWLAKVS